MAFACRVAEGGVTRPNWTHPMSVLGTELWSRACRKYDWYPHWLSVQIVGQSVGSRNRMALFKRSCPAYPESPTTAQMSMH